MEAMAYHEKYNKLAFYDPYPFQKEFHSLKGLGTDKVASQVGLICANQIGKTTAGAAEAAYHALGEYPDWWEGVRYQCPVIILCCGVSNDSTKRIIQHELLGGIKGTQDWGSGMIPKKSLGEPTRKAGVPDAYESVLVKGKYGNSKIWLMAYEQGWKKFQGVRFHFGWPDEEPPEDIWSQMLRGTISQKNSRMAMTMTPEEGLTKVVVGFMNDLQEGQALVTATWDDAKHAEDTKLHKKGDTHLTEDKKRQILSALPEWQRDMRSKGIPMMGSGLVWPIKEETILTDPVEIQSYWPRVAAIDFGVDHPTAGVWLAWDRDLDIVYVYDTYRKSRSTISENAMEFRKRETWIPVMWPHDGNQEDPKSCKTKANLYRAEGVNMWYESFTNPPEGAKKGDIGVEAGIEHIYERMTSGRFKVFRGLSDWFEEFRMYHRKEGKVVPLRDDIMSATRYATMSLRNARTHTSANFKEKLNYSNKGIV
jgi:phage terminase large subunit-like protein